MNVSVNTTMTQQQCMSAGGQWVPPGVDYTVSPNGTVQTNASDQAAISLANGVGNSFPAWTASKGWNFSPNACSWIAVGAGFGSAVAGFSPEPVSKAGGFVMTTVSALAAILGNCI